GEDDLFPADAVGQGAEDQEERRAENQRQANQEVRRDEVELQVDEDEEQRVELAGVPDDALPCRRTQQRQRHVLVVRILEEAVLQRRLAAFALRFHPAEQRRLVELQPDIDRHQEQRDREPERNAPAPTGEGLRIQRIPAE